jgi:hypothetical protein
MAAPSWAANQGNSNNQGNNENNNPRLCTPGAYPGVLLNQKGAAFKSATACAQYVENNGRLIGVNAVAGPMHDVGILVFEVTYSGFGLKPGSEALGCAKYSTGPTANCLFAHADATGTFSGTESATCLGFGGTVSSLLIQATTASGTVFQQEFPPPSGC